MISMPFRRVFRQSRKNDFWGELQDSSLAEGTLHRATAQVLCFVILGLTGFALALNGIEGNWQLFVPLLAVIMAAVIALVWVRIRKEAEFGPLYLCIGALALLGVYLLLEHSAPDGSSLFWFLLFPPMTMFCLGLRRGTIVCCCFLFFLTLLFATPMRAFLAEPLPQTIRFRFLMAMMGAFFFSWGAEYTRSQTQKALARIMLRLEQDSLTDPLTGLGNRRGFYNYYSIAFLGTSAEKRAFAVAIVDIDFFKNINDTFGHEVGDKVLCHISNIFRSLCRESDKLYRWGGEEFLIFMPKTTAAEAECALERMRKGIKQTPYIGDGGEKITLSASFGLAAGGAGENINFRIDAADQALYVAKGCGRNRVELYRGPA